MQNIREAVDLYVESLIAHHERVPATARAPLPDDKLQVKSAPVSL